ncbi:MAG: cysteine--tRNA ligase [Eubacteriales bacterium]|jgi:cysteinyl-tRNA synthetase|nr:cysteine--tRNA ligase [Eubacteriales bacterium]MDD3289767.1 cysteine--tRNA ligase [Eubacteriales bacterium]MDD3864036.1 cysteine--tRNA ligase [Eubacteriales bacterium]MDD4445142.1 cysteine--tRNA ligase [Eubacteriales bacterium]
MRVYNTLTRKKEDFIPLDKNEIRMYVCGPTVYNYIHIGNARPFVVFDTMRKYLEYRGEKVCFVQNFTDVDDKIINRAREEGISPYEVGDKYIKAYFEDVEALNVTPATVHPRVTETIPEIIAFVEGLIQNGLAYEVDGDVYYSARKFPDYGKLSKQNIEELEAGSRVNVDERKQDPLDFALWKAQKAEDEMAWDSPWGRGRPGWHIECSAMSRKYLGETIDLHAGGQDLQFPHHENEIAQSEGYSGKPFSRYWMHNGYITVDNEKMSKSLGNFFTVRDILKEYDGEVLRYFLLSGHYRGPINFSRDLMEQSKSALERMKNAKGNLIHLIDTGSGSLTTEEKQKINGYGQYREKFIAAMDDDLNTADAISAIFELIRDINTDMQAGASQAFAEEALSLLDELTGVLGLLRKEKDDQLDEGLEKLIEERQEARKRKDFARADAIRDELAARGITLKDTPQGVQIIRS